MERILSIIEVVLPIFATVVLGLLAKKQELLTGEQVAGLQRFSVKFGMPCIVFNACLTAKIGTDALATMVLGVLPVLAATLWAFRERERSLKYFNLPMLFAGHETGMLGIPLTMTLFGAAQSYRMGVLDLAQAFVAFPVIAILSSNTGKAPTLGQILKGVFTSPLMIMSMLGLTLNLSGVAAWMENVNVLGIVTGATSFLGQPVSALMLFSVGYHFSIDENSRKDIFKVSGIFFGWYTLTGLVIQGLLCFVPGVEMMTRWVMMLYCMMPASYLAPGLGRSEADQTLASGVCSVLTGVGLVAFCVISAFVV